MWKNAEKLLRIHNFPQRKGISCSSVLIKVSIVDKTSKTETTYSHVGHTKNLNGHTKNLN